MTIEEIFEMWNSDSKLDISELATEAANTPYLHGKYLKLYTHERLRLKALEKDIKRLKLAKHTFYMEGPSKETQELGWKIPPRGTILKADIPMYLDADEDMIKLQLKIDMTQERVSMLESIIKMINNRGFLIKNIQDDIRWKNGS